MNEKFKEILIGVNSEIFDDPDCDLIEDEVLDSLGIMTIITECEETFDIDFDPNDIVPQNFSSPEKIWALIEKYQREVHDDDI